MSISNPVKVYLYPNNLNDDNGKYYARIVSYGSLDLEQIAQSAIDRGGATMSVEDMMYGHRAILQEALFQARSGFLVNLEYFTLTAKINGVFTNELDTYDSSRHSLSFNLIQTATTREEVGEISLDIIGIADTMPAIASVTDVKTGSVNSTLTPGRVARIEGSRIKVSGDDSTVGVYFVNVDSGTSTRVDDDDLVRNYPAEVEVMIPELEAGSYNVQIVTQYSHANKVLSEPRTATFDTALTVA